MGEKQPGIKARLIREGLEQHPDLAPAELARLLKERHPGADIDFQAAEISLVKQILAAQLPKAASSGELRIPPMREHENPALQDMLASGAESANGLGANDLRVLRDLVRKAGSARQLIQVIERLQP
jgi:hypothetical protein